MTELSIVAIVVLAVLAALWFWSANRPWAERVLGHRLRGFENPETIAEATRFLGKSPSESTVAWRALRTQSVDPETEYLRIRVWHRFVVFCCLMLSAPVVALMAYGISFSTPSFVAAGPLTSILLVGELGIVLRGAVLLARYAFSYGNGGAIEPGRIARATAPVLGICVVVVAQALVLRA